MRTRILGHLVLPLCPRDNCIIYATGLPGANGNNGANGPSEGNGGLGTDGLPGQNGRSVTIEAGLAKVGGLIIITDGGPGGRGGAGGPGGQFDTVSGAGGGGSGAPGGDAGQISLTWTRLAPQLPLAQGASPKVTSTAATEVSVGLAALAGLAGPCSTHFNSLVSQARMVPTLPTARACRFK